MLGRDTAQTAYQSNQVLHQLMLFAAHRAVQSWLQYCQAETFKALHPDASHLPRDICVSSVELLGDDAMRQYCSGGFIRQSPDRSNDAVQLAQHLDQLVCHMQC